MKALAGVVALLVAAGCGGSGHHGSVTVHVALDLQRSFAATPGSCHGTGALADYAEGRALVLDDQNSRRVSSVELPAGVDGRNGCEFHFVVTVLTGTKSVWLPMSELGTPGCTSSRRGAVIFDRSTTGAASINSTLGLPARIAHGVSARCT
jgi:hypothetical protein